MMIIRSDMRYERIIVTDYNGHVRIEQADLDRLYALEAKENEHQSEVKKLRQKISELKKACDNFASTNEALSREISELRWALKEAENTIEQLQKIDVEVVIE